MPPPGHATLVLAKEYGQSPEQVEHWDMYWFERALLKLEGEGIANKKQMERMKRDRR